MATYQKSASQIEASKRAAEEAAKAALFFAILVLPPAKKDPTSAK